MPNDDLIDVVNASTKCACLMGHEYIGTEHILLGLLSNRGLMPCQVLRNLGFDLDELAQFIPDMIQSRASALPDQVLPVTARVKMCLDQAVIAAAESSTQTPASMYLFLAILAQEESVLAQILSVYGLDYDEVKAECDNIISGRPTVPTVRRSRRVKRM